MRYAVPWLDGIMISVSVRTGLEDMIHSDARLMRKFRLHMSRTRRVACRLDSVPCALPACSGRFLPPRANVNGKRMRWDCVTSPTVTVTKDILSHALDKIGLTNLVSASLLYGTILQLQQSVPSPSPPPTSEWPGCKITLWSESIFNTPSADE